MRKLSGELLFVSTSMLFIYSIQLNLALVSQILMRQFLRRSHSLPILGISLCYNVLHFPMLQPRNLQDIAVRT